MAVQLVKSPQSIAIPGAETYIRHRGETPLPGRIALITAPRGLPIVTEKTADTFLGFPEPIVYLALFAVAFVVFAAFLRLPAPRPPRPPRRSSSKRQQALLRKNRRQTSRPRSDPLVDHLTRCKLSTQPARGAH